MLEKFSTEELKNELNKRMVEKSKTKKRYEILAIHKSNSDEPKIVHREYTAEKSFVDSVDNLKTIELSNGTSLIFEIRPLDYKEKKQKDIRAYSNLIRDCINQSTNKENDLKK